MLAFSKPLPALAVALLAVGGLALQARALIITPTFDSTITSDPDAAAIESTINQAIQTYENTFADPITVSIKYQENSSIQLGESQTTVYSLPYSTYRSALAADATTANDATALTHLPTGPANPVTGTSNIVINTANIRAVGISGSFPASASGGFDGIISLNTTQTAPPNSLSNSTYSLITVVEHEMDEVLGLGSALNSSSTTNPAPEDLFRYDTSGNRNYTTAGDNAWFSIDGTTDLVQFNQNGTGDYGDWHTSTTPRVQDAFGTPDVTPPLGVEITALDAIGYNPVPVPEPATVAIASLLTGLLLFRRRPLQPPVILRN